ncbi:hypothetical protein OK016_29740 [Vibrio chagasii]|nr:hypothetical protein [Vibrio chagasii]
MLLAVAISARKVEPASKSKWLDDLNWLTQTMIDQYHSEDEQRFSTVQFMIKQR